jgi:glycosyltransferase involved in cell wall biosynthesis
MSTVSVVIPCYPPHLQYLPRLLANLQQQTYYPQEVIIALSECSRVQAQHLQRELTPLVRCPLKLAISPYKGYAGPNRNRGAALATSTYIAFLDADDVYHSQKLEHTRAALDLTGADICLHSFNYAPGPSTFSQQKYLLQPQQITPSTTIYTRTFGTPPRRNRAAERHLKSQLGIEAGYLIHHGHPTVRASVMDTVQYSDMPRGQDCFFLRDALFDYHKQAIALPIALSLYKFVRKP